MGINRPNFRYCFHELTDGSSREFLPLWADQLLPVMERLQRYASASARMLTGRDISEDLWELYALSRVNDYLLLPFQPSNPNVTPYMSVLLHSLSFGACQDFWEALGMQVVAPREFHPFFHEITTVVQAADQDEPITIIETRWPALMWGDLLISRAGVTVRGGINHVRADTASSSILFFAYTRRYRHTRDLSQGWGSNSQWRTDFRRDYMDAEAFYYNVDGTVDVWQPSPKPNINRDCLTPKQRHELLVNRCFIVSAEHSRDGDLWPYHDTVIEERTYPAR